MRSFRSAYEAKRAAALAGVPERTLYYWAEAEVGVLRPSLSAERRNMRWSYSDLLTARLVYWLRQEKRRPTTKNTDFLFSRTPMPEVRELLANVESLGDQLNDETVVVEVDPGGSIVLTVAGERYEPKGQLWLTGIGPKQIKLLQAFEHGPNLWQPRMHLRIIPGTLSGEPHVSGKRIPTELIADMRKQGFENDTIRRAYPELEDEEIGDAVDLEDALQSAA